MEAKTSLERNGQADEVMKFSPVVSTSLGQSVLFFLMIAASSLGAGIAGVFLVGLGFGMGTFLVGSIGSSFLALRWLKERNLKAARDLPKLEIREGKLHIPCQQGESITIVLNSPYEFSTRWTRGKGEVTTYKTELLILQGITEVMLFSEEPVSSETLRKSGFLGFEDLHIGRPGKPTFAMKLNDLLKVWQVLRAAQKSG